MLELMGKGINIFHLVNHQISLDDDKFRSREVTDELAIITLEEDISSTTTFNDAQQYAYDSVLQRVFSHLKVLHSLLIGLVE